MKPAMMLFCVGLATSAVAAAVPEVSNVNLDADARRVNVTYTLTGAPAIVTAMFLTNGVPVDSVTALGGDVNRLVTNLTGTCSFSWVPECSWPGHRIKDGSLSVHVTAWSTNCPPDYMAINLTVTNAVFFYERAADVPGGVTNELYKTEWLLMRKIPAAGVVWHMGSPMGERNRSTNEVQHLVMLTRDYYIGVYMVTQRQYKLFANAVPNNKSNSDATFPDHWIYPVNALTYTALRGSTHTWPQDGHQVTADSAMGKLRGLTGIDSFDLPTEAEWEYACRAGMYTATYDGRDDATLLTNLCWYSANSAVNGSNAMHPVGLKLPNAWGLYDMYGNTMERCLDWFGMYQNTDGISVDPSGPLSGTTRVDRGGSLDHNSTKARSAARDSNAETSTSYYNGLRVKCATALSL